METKPFSRYGTLEKTDDGWEAVFTGQPSNYYEGGWKHITLEGTSQGKFVGSPFSFNGEVNYQGRPLFVPGLRVNGVEVPFRPKLDGNSLRQDIPNLGRWSVIFQEASVSETLEVEVEKDLIEFTPKKTPRGLTETPRRVGHQEVGNFIRAGDFKTPYEVDPDYVAINNFGTIANSGAVTWAGARSTATGFGSNQIACSVNLTPDAAPYVCFRGYLGFDTRGYPSEWTIERVQLLLQMANKSGSEAGFYVGYQDWSANMPLSSSNMGVVFAAYPSTNQFYGDVVYFSTSGAEGQRVEGPDLDTSWVNKTGITTFVMRIDYDVNNVSPNGFRFADFFLPTSTQVYRRPLLRVLTYPRNSSFMSIPTY